MRIFRSKEDSLKFGLSLFLIGGSILGTLFCNRMTGEMKQELMILGQSSVTEVMVEGIDRYGLWMQIFTRRIWLLILMMLAAAAPIADWCMRFVAVYIGFSNSVIICALTMESGVRGLIQYLLLIFPQCICYVPVGYLLMWWMPVREKTFTIISILFLFCLAGAGTLLEGFINPWFLTWF